MNKSQKLTRKRFVECVTRLNRIAQYADNDSPLRGLEAVAAAFAILLDIYAFPNPCKPVGTFESPQVVREYFAHIILSCPGPGAKADTEGNIEVSA